MKKRKGTVRVEIFDLAYEEFSDMNFFEKFIPENTKVEKVQIVHDFGYYDEPDNVYFNIEWNLKE